MKKFYKTVVVIEVVGDRTFGDADLEALQDEIQELHYESASSLVSQGRIQSTTALSSRMAAKKIVEFGGDLDDFEIDENGNDVQEEEEDPAEIEEYRDYEEDEEEEDGGEEEIF